MLLESATSDIFSFISAPLGICSIPYDAGEQSACVQCHGSQHYVIPGAIIGVAINPHRLVSTGESDESYDYNQYFLITKFKWQRTCETCEIPLIIDMTSTYSNPSQPTVDLEAENSPEDPLFTT